MRAVGTRPGAASRYHQAKGQAAEIVRGGLESITMMQNDFNKKNLFNPWLMDHKKDIYMPMGLTAEIVAARYKVSREKQDEMALASQQRTAAAQKEFDRACGVHRLVSCFEIGAGS